MAYAIDGKVFVHTEWANLKYSVDEKPKTIILLDENYKALGFGKDAKHKYVLNTFRISYFKLSIYLHIQLYVITDDEGKMVII